MLKIVVWHEAHGLQLADAFLGHVDVPLTKIRWSGTATEVSFPLQQREKSEIITGEIKLQLGFQQVQPMVSQAISSQNVV